MLFHTIYQNARYVITANYFKKRQRMELNFLSQKEFVRKYAIGPFVSLDPNFTLST